MNTPARDRLLRVPLLGGALRRLAAIARLPASLQALNARLDELGVRMRSLETRFDDIAELMLGDVGPDAGRPLDIAALRNQLDSVPLELSALRRDIARLEGGT